MVDIEYSDQIGIEAESKSFFLAFNCCCCLCCNFLINLGISWTKIVFGDGLSQEQLSASNANRKSDLFIKNESISCYNRDPAKRPETHCST